MNKCLSGLPIYSSILKTAGVVLPALFLFLFSPLLAMQVENSNSGQLVRAEIDLTQEKTPIDPLLYGHFIENLSNWFEGGLWAEMLGDRKFFYPVDNRENLDPPNSRDWILGKWIPYGPEEAITMDTERSYVGEHSPRIKLDRNNRRGIQQSGLPLENGKDYEGRVILAGQQSLYGNPLAEVNVSLVWGSGAEDRETITIQEITSDYQKFDLEFTSRADTRDGRLEITGTGIGWILIGAVSLMPADNIEGFRPDLLDLHREMNVTMLRWGGNFTAGYEWRDGIGDRDKRPPRYDYAWNAVEQNDVGTFEFLALNRLIGSEPNIGVNSGLGDAYSAALWLEYVNGSIDTPMGKLRAKHGHPEPFDVKWWGIGNEMNGDWQLGHMQLRHYVINHNMFAQRMREVDPSIILVASGASPYEMNTTFRHWRNPPFPGTIPIEWGGDYDWSGGLLEHSSGYFEYIAEHFYPRPEHTFDLERQEWIELEDEPKVNQVRRPANRVQAAVEAWHEYNERMPHIKDTDIQIVLDEWVAGGRGLRGALSTATVLNEIYRYTDIFKMSAYTCGPCALAYDGVNSGFHGDGLVFKLFANQFGKYPVEVNGNSPQREIPGAHLVDQPLVSSGSATWPFDVMAALSADRQELTISVVNPTEDEQTLDLSIVGGELSELINHWIIRGNGNDWLAVNQPGEDPVITLEESASQIAIGDSVPVEPLSVNLYSFKLQ